jgi:hypothetical protein
VMGRAGMGRTYRECSGEGVPLFHSDRRPSSQGASLRRSDRRASKIF